MVSVFFYAYSSVETIRAFWVTGKATRFNIVVSLPCTFTYFFGDSPNIFLKCTHPAIIRSFSEPLINFTRILEVRYSKTTLYTYFCSLNHKRCLLIY